MMEVLVNRNRLLRLRALAFVVLALVMLALLADLYWLGLYTRVLALMLTPPLLLLAAGAIWMEASALQSFWVCLLTLTGLVIPQLWLMADDLQASLHGLLMVPFLSCLMLEHRLAYRINLLMCGLVLVVALLNNPCLEALRAAMIYLLVMMAVAMLARMLLQRQALLHSLMLHDEVSGACNARHFSVVLGREVARSQRARRPVSLIGLSLEEYGQLLHLHGAAAVAHFLADLVVAVRQEVRAGDDIFRLRDDLFVLMLPDCPEDGAIVLMERIKRQLDQRQSPAMADMALAVATVTRTPDENGVDLEKRLTKRLAKQRRANLQAAAFVNG